MTRSRTRLLSVPQLLVGLCGFALAVFVGAGAGVSCGGGDCQLYPRDCGFGSVGAYCDRDGECDTGYCCGKSECDRGMCTFRCDGDRDCPSDMGCEHGACFFLCHGDRDCAPGWECKHGNTVCERD